MESVVIFDHPVYIKHLDISMLRGNHLIVICNAARNVVKNQIVGAYKARGIWKIYVKNYEARVKLLTLGLTINNRHVDTYSENPFAHKYCELSEKYCI